MMALITGVKAHPPNTIQTGVQLTEDAAGFSAIHLFTDAVSFEVYNTLGQSLTGRLTSDASFQVDLNKPGVQYWPYLNVEVNFPQDGDASTVIQNYFNAGSSNVTLIIYGPNGVVHNAPIPDNGLTGFQPIGTFADLGITAPGDYYLKFNWEQAPGSAAVVPYAAWEKTLLDELKSLGLKDKLLDQFEAWLATHPPMP